MERKNDRLPIFTERFIELQGERSNTEFADFLGISRQTVGFYYNGDRVPDALTLIKISQRCGVSADWLLGISNVKTLDVKLKQVCEYTGLSENAVLFIKGLYDQYFPTSEENPITTILSMLLESDNFMQVLGGLAIACNLEAESHESMDVKAIDKFIELHEQELKEIGATVWGAGPTSDMFLHQANYRFMECMRQVRSCFSPK